ncbi:DNA primase [Francisella sp. LA112445]|uniref:DNA primase n=1 Tax=Francisella sp. LA112445 TaxID=1395624 RepID=UPI001788E02A|nr:DNA primase [Francisella sp. LA112445]QIW10593.1 DNA primase [Francisella sp. LA112445]
MDSIQLRDFAESNGYTLPNNFDYNIGIGEIVRFKDINKNKDNKDLWIKNIDNNIFVFGDWKTGEKYTYIDNDSQYNYHGKKEVSYKVQQQKKAELQSKQELAKKLGAYYLSLPKANDNHAYLVAKGIKSHGVIKQDKDKLIIPCIGIEEPFKGKLQSIQTILPNGFKQFYKGANAKDSFLMLNKSSNDSFIFVEGLATGISVLNAIYDKDNISVIVCFNCNNLKPIVSYFYSLYPNANLCIFADDDKNGVGIKKANEVAAIIPSIKIYPPPFDPILKETFSELSDWNDYLQIYKTTIIKGDF